MRAIFFGVLIFNFFHSFTVHLNVIKVFYLPTDAQLLLLLFGAESFLFQFAIQKFKDQDI